MVDKELTPSAILTADWHLREDTPVCRKDKDFQQTQWDKVDFVSSLQRKYSCPVIHAGDLFNHWKASPWLIYKAMKHLPKQFYSIYGNHDLPQHSLELVDKCGMNVLIYSKHVTLLQGTHWGKEPEVPSIEIQGRKILVWHKMTYLGELPFPGCTEESASEITAKSTEYDLILTGHNHKPFTVKEKKTILVNPGSLMRQDAAQVDFEPRVYLYFAETNTVKPVYIPILPTDVSREYLDKIQERENRIDAFISSLNSDFAADVSFEKNMEVFLNTNTVRTSVKDIIYKSLEKEPK